MCRERIAPGRFPVWALRDDGGFCQFHQLLQDLYAAGFVPALDAISALVEMAMVGPNRYRNLDRELADGVREFRFPHPDLPVSLCIQWFYDYPNIICTRACVQDGDNVSENDLSESVRMRRTYLLTTGSQGSSYVH